MLQTGEEEEVDEAFYSQPRAVLKSWALVRVWDFDYPDFCRRIYAVKHKPSRRFLGSIDNTFLSQAVEDPTRNCVA